MPPRGERTPPDDPPFVATGVPAASSPIRHRRSALRGFHRPDARLRASAARHAPSRRPPAPRHPGGTPTHAPAARAGVSSRGPSPRSIRSAARWSHRARGKPRPATDRSGSRSGPCSPAGGATASPWRRALGRRCRDETRLIRRGRGAPGPRPGSQQPRPSPASPPAAWDVALQEHVRARARSSSDTRRTEVVHPSARSIAAASAPRATSARDRATAWAPARSTCRHLTRRLDDGSPQTRCDAPAQRTATPPTVVRPTAGWRSTKPSSAHSLDPARARRRDAAQRESIF
jgi:hypothetical protein